MIQFDATGSAITTAIAFFAIEACKKENNDLEYMPDTVAMRPEQVQSINNLFMKTMLNTKTVAGNNSLPLPVRRTMPVTFMGIPVYEDLGLRVDEIVFRDADGMALSVIKNLGLHQ